MEPSASFLVAPALGLPLSFRTPHAGRPSALTRRAVAPADVMQPLSCSPEVLVVLYDNQVLSMLLVYMLVAATLAYVNAIK